jgi:hypothetical protein
VYKETKPQRQDTGFAPLRLGDFKMIHSRVLNLINLR